MEENVIIYDDVPADAPEISVTPEPTEIPEFTPTPETEETDNLNTEETENTEIISDTDFSESDSEVSETDIAVDSSTEVPVVSYDCNFEFDYDFFKNMIYETTSADKEQSIMEKPLTEYTPTEGLLLIIVLILLLRIVWDYSRKDI